MAASRQNRRKKRRTVASMPMAPMIDMVFLLLVFFMTASAMSQAGSKLEVKLPEAPSSQVPKELSDRLIVSVDREGVAHMGGISLDDQELAERLRAEHEANPSVKLRVRADKGTEFEAIKRVMKAAAKAGIESYLYATYQGEA